MNVLAVGAHPDDLDISCGGTIIRLARSGARVVMCIVTDGRAYPIGDPDQVSARRMAEVQKSAALAGAELAWLGFPDGRLFDDFATRLRFIELIMRVQPDLILTHSPEDYHPDHITTSRLVMAAVQIAEAPPPELQGDPLRKTVPVGFFPPSHGINFLPEEYVDVSEVWDTKLQMALHHRSQYLAGPDYDSQLLEEPLDQYEFARLTRIVDSFYGLQCGCRCAEGFRWWRAAGRLIPRRLLP